MRWSGCPTAGAQGEGARDSVEEGGRGELGHCQPASAGTEPRGMACSARSGCSDEGQSELAAPALGRSVWTLHFIL